jgi:hypothetical protein
MINFAELNKKKLVLFSVILFVFASVVLPSVHYFPALSTEKCATTSYIGERNLCDDGSQSLLQVIVHPNTNDFLFLLITGIAANIAASVVLTIVGLSLHHRMYAQPKSQT